MNTTARSSFTQLGGIIDKVRAVRGNDDEVLYVEATIHVKMGDDYKGVYGYDVSTELVLPLPVTTEVNPGDVAEVTFSTRNPFGQRFVGALTVGNEDEDEDALDVMVEDGMVEEVSDNG